MLYIHLFYIACNDLHFILHSYMCKHMWIKSYERLLTLNGCCVWHECRVGMNWCACLYVRTECLLKVKVKARLFHINFTNYIKNESTCFTVFCIQQTRKKSCKTFICLRLCKWFQQDNSATTTKNIICNNLLSTIK
jgi:hypothetical protein